VKFHGLKNEIVHEAKVTREPAIWTDITGREPSPFQRIILPNGILDMEATCLGNRRGGQYHAGVCNNKVFDPVVPSLEAGHRFSLNAERTG